MSTLPPEVSFTIAEYIDDRDTLMKWLKINTRLYLDHQYWRDNMKKLTERKKQQFTENWRCELILTTIGISLLNMKGSIIKGVLIGPIIPIVCYVSSGRHQMRYGFANDVVLTSSSTIYAECYSVNLYKELHGPFTIYTSNSVVYCSYNRGVLEGTYRELQADYKTKRLISVMKSDKNDDPPIGRPYVNVGRRVLEEELIRPKSPPILMSTGNYKSGKMDGKWTTHDIYGCIIFEAIYKDGQFVSK
jgi:hypothetical protein